MADCDEKKFYSPGQTVGRETKAASCVPAEQRVPEELRRPAPDAPVEVKAPDPAPLQLRNHAQVAQCTEDEYGNPRYGDPSLVVAGVFTETYKLQGIVGITDDTLRYIENNDLLPWLTTYINAEGWYSEDIAGEHGPSKSAAVVAAKTGLTKTQADQLLKETEVILLQLDALALQAAQDTLSCVWKNVLIQLPCPVETVEYENDVFGAVVAAGTVSSFASQDDADSRATVIGNNNLICHYISREYTATCEDDRDMPGVPTDLHPVYPGLEPRLASYTVSRGAFTSLTSADDASERAEQFAVEQLVCYYVNDPVEQSCTDPSAGTVIEVALPDGTTRFELSHVEGDAAAGIPGQHILIPKGMYTSEVSADMANENAQLAAESLLECCFVNKPRLTECDPQPLVASDGSPMLDADTGAQIYVNADPDTSVNIKNEVAGGTFYSCVSQEDADLQAEALMQQELLCSYCNIEVQPGCVPDWVLQAATEGVVLTRALYNVPQPDGTTRDYAPGDVYKLSLPLDLDFIVDPSTGELTSTEGWSVDATVGAAVKMYCTDDANQSQRLAELNGSNTVIKTGKELCEYKNVKVIVSCSGGDPFTSCPTCSRKVMSGGMLRYHVENGMPVKLAEAYEDTSDTVQLAGEVYNKGGLWEYMVWRSGYMNDTGERFVFGMASIGTPWDDEVSFPNCGQYLSIDAGIFSSSVSEEDATMTAMELAVSMMHCVHTNPEIHLYCPMQDEGTGFVAYNYWHPSPYDTLPNECSARAAGEGYEQKPIHQAPFVPYYKTLPPINVDPPMSMIGCMTMLGEENSFTAPCFKSRYYDTTWCGRETEEEAGNADDFIKDGDVEKMPYLDPYWVWGNRAVLPSYAGPELPYVGAIPNDLFAPGANIMKLSGKVNTKYSWTMRILSKNPVVIAARLMQQVNYGSQFSVWQQAVEYGIQQLYCDKCAPGASFSFDAPGCCKDPDALNTCVKKKQPTTSQDDTYTVSTNCKTDADGGSIGYLPDCWFYGKTKKEAVRKRNCFIATFGGGEGSDEETPCLYGNVRVSKELGCVNIKLEDDILMKLKDVEETSVAENTVISEVSIADATAKALTMLDSLAGLVCPYLSAEVVYSCVCDEEIVGADRHCLINGEFESITIPAGYLISDEKHTQQLTEEVREMAKTMTQCIMKNEEITISCDDESNEYKYDVWNIVKIEEGQFQAPCCDYTSREMFNNAIKDMFAPMVMCMRCNKVRYIDCDYSNSNKCQFAETDAIHRININPETTIPSGLFVQITDGNRNVSLPDPDESARKMACAMSQCVVANNEVRGYCPSSVDGGSIIVPEGLQVTIEGSTIVLPASVYTQADAQEKANELAKASIFCMVTNQYKSSYDCSKLCTNSPDSSEFVVDAYEHSTCSTIPHKYKVDWVKINDGVVLPSTLWFPIQDCYSIFYTGGSMEDPGTAEDATRQVNNMAQALANSMAVCVANYTLTDTFEDKYGAARTVVPAPTPCEKSVEQYE